MKTDPPSTQQAVSSCPQDTKKNISEWLVSLGVSRKHSDRFFRQVDCLDIVDLATFLRFELAPLQLANDDNINMDMRSYFGCSPKVASRLIRALDVFSMLPPRDGVAVPDATVSSWHRNMLLLLHHHCPIFLLD
jgi:hypothetical protein